MHEKKRGQPSSLQRFGVRVRELRRAKGLTQEDLADASGLDRSYVGSLERGERNVSLVNILKIAKGLGVPASALLDFGSRRERGHG